MRVGLFGGSFDPIHRGHIEPVERVLQELDLERVYYLPTAQPPHKSDRRFAPALARYAMVEIALLAEPRLMVSTAELTPERRAYTVDTVESYRRRFSGDDLFLIVGADAFNELDTWRRWQDLVELVTLVVLERAGVRVDMELLRERSGSARVVRFDNPPLDVSSTELRARLRAGRSLPADAIPAAVLDYIRKYSLYR